MEQDQPERPKRPEEETPFERFASATKRLFAVPKEEAEKKAREAKSKRKPRRPH